MSGAKGAGACGHEGEGEGEGGGDCEDGDGVAARTLLRRRHEEVGEE